MTVLKFFVDLTAFLRAQESRGGRPGPGRHVAVPNGPSGLRGLKATLNLV